MKRGGSPPRRSARKKPNCSGRRRPRHGAREKPKRSGRKRPRRSAREKPGRNDRKKRTSGDDESRKHEHHRPRPRRNPSSPTRTSSLRSSDDPQSSLSTGIRFWSSLISPSGGPTRRRTSP